MFPFSRFKRSSLIGLDVQPDQICLLQIASKRKMPHIESYAVAELPAGIIVDGRIMAVERLTAVIRQLVNETKTHHAKTAIALPSNCVISKSIQLPAALSVGELEAEIHLRLSQYLPGMSDEICFDYHKLQTDQQLQDILLVAAKNQLMTTYVNAVNQAGLTVKIVEVDVYAIARAFNYCVKPSGKVLALLDATHTSANFLVLHEQQLIYSHQVVLDLTVENVLMQLQSIIQAYDAVHRSHEIACVYLSGKLFLLETTAQTFEAVLAIPVEILDITHSLTSLGLSLRGGVYG